MMALGARQSPGRPLVGFVIRTRKEDRSARPTRAGKHAFVTNKQDAISAGDELVVRLKTLRTRRHEPAFIPGEFDGRHLAPGTEVVSVQTRDGSDIGIHAAG